MKKLIISIVATASIALVAKADVAPNATSFENYPEDVAFSVDLDDNGDDAGDMYWSGGKEGQFEFIDVVAGAKTDRPKYWDGEDDAKALSIDTDVALSRHVATKNAGAQDIGDGLYFDSMGQFTATDMAPTVTETDEDVTGDKLIVWLREVVAAENETPATYALYVTAGVKDQSQIITTHYELTSVADIAPDSWHRLTIAISKTGATPTFKVYVDGEQATSTKIYNPDGDDETITAIGEFGSLTPDGANNAGTITSVDFQGKGAIDDLVWTTDVNDVFAPETTTVTVTYNGPEIDAEAGPFFSYTSGETGGEIVFTDGSCSLMLGLGKTAEFTCLIASGWKVEGFGKGAEEGGYVTWTKSVENVTADFTSLAIKITQEAPAAPKPFTVKIAGVDTPFETLAKAIAAAAAAGGEEIKLNQAATLTEKLTVAEAAVIDLNGQTLTLANVEGYAVVVKGALTIKDSVGGGVINVPGSYGFGIGTFIENIDAPGSLTVKGGSIIGKKAEYLIGVFVGNATIEGGNFAHDSLHIG